jgi:hypothetical protein
MNVSFIAHRIQFSVERFEQMAQKGLFGPDERVESIEGDIVPMAPLALPQCALSLENLFVIAD